MTVCSLSPRDQLRILGAEQWAERVAHKHGTTLSEVLGKYHHPHVVAARRDIVCTLRDTLALSSTVAGRALGLDHTTVLNHETTRNAQRGWK